LSYVYTMIYLHQTSKVFNEWPRLAQYLQGDISVHNCKERRYKCHVCGKTFAETRGTAFYRLRMARDLVVTVVTLPTYGCPVQAIVVAFRLDGCMPRSKGASSGWQ
jgi:transposase-like protein